MNNIDTMSTDIHSEPSTKQVLEGTKESACRTAGAARETAKIAAASAKDVPGGVEEVAGDVTDAAKHAVRRATGTAKYMYQTAPVKTGDAPATSKGYGRRNPVPFFLGEINFGAVIGYLLMAARR